MSSVLQAQNSTGKLRKGKTPKGAGWITIDEDLHPLPADYPEEFYLWDFGTEDYIPDQSKRDFKSNRKQAGEDHIQAKKDEHARIKALLDDVSTKWNDPQGDLLKALHSGFEEILRKDA